MTSDIGSTQPPSQPAAAPPAKTNPFARIGGALFAPNETFREIAAKPDFGVALAVLLIVGAICTFIIAQHVDFESSTREAFESQSQQMSKEDIDRAVRIGSSVARALMYFAPVISLIFYVAIAAILLLAFKMFGGEGTFKQAFSVTLYAWYPLLIKGILMAIIVMSRGIVPADQINNVVMSNLGFLVNMKEQPVLHALLSSIDVFNIWALALFTIGFSWVSRLSKAVSGAIVVGLWLVTLVIKLGFAALAASRMKQA